MQMTAETGLISAMLLDGHGGGRKVGWTEIRDWNPGQKILWVHLDFTQADARDWLFEHSGLEPLVAEALIAGETRPRCDAVADGLLISLRGVNVNPGADPEDMVAIRLFCTADRVISTRRRSLLTIPDLMADLERGEGAKSPGELVANLAERLIERMSQVMTDLDDRMDDLEERLIEGVGQESRSTILELRREIIMLRRYLAPQREALNRLQSERVSWLSGHDRLSVRETSDKVTRYVEDLDSARDRAGVAYEELASRLAEQMNARMYLLSLIAGLFLPLGFLTGLFGINVGGIPLSDDPWGFIAVVLFLLLLMVLQVLIFRRKRWF